MAAAGPCFTVRVGGVDHAGDLVVLPEAAGQGGSVPQTGLPLQNSLQYKIRYLRIFIKNTFLKTVFQRTIHP